MKRPRQFHCLKRLLDVSDVSKSETSKNLQHRFLSQFLMLNRMVTSILAHSAAFDGTLDMVIVEGPTL